MRGRGYKTGITGRIRSIDTRGSRTFKCSTPKELYSICALAYRLNTYNERNGIVYRCEMSLKDLTVTITAVPPCDNPTKLRKR